MTNIKDALEQIRAACDEPLTYGRSNLADKVARIADQALASLQGEDAVERVAQTAQAFWQSPSGRSWIECCEKLPQQAEWFRRLARAILATGLVPDEAARDEDDAYEIGKRDGYEEAIQEMDLATGGDGEFKGSTIPGATIDVPEMKARIAARLRDDTQLKQCAICGFTIDTFFAAVKPTADFTTRGRAKAALDESAIRAEATDAMVAAAHNAEIFLNMTDEGWRKAWRAMYAAAIRSNGRGA